MRLAVPLSKLLARLHLWYPAAVVLAQEPLGTLDRYSVGRMSYALMMSNGIRQGSADALFRRILDDTQQRTPELTLELAEMATRIQQPALAEDLLREAVAASSDAHTRQAAECLLRTAEGVRDGSLQTQVHTLVAALALAADERVVLVPLSGAYRDMFQLWLQQVRRHAGVRVIVLAMDDASLAAATGHPDLLPVDLHSYFAWKPDGTLQPQTRGVLWFLRTVFLRELVSHGHTTLVLDTDAMLVGNVWSMVAAQGACDVVAQFDHSLPMDVNRQLGFVLCCGFMLWQPTPPAQELLDRFAAAAQVERDDQMALNHLLARDGIADKQEHPLGIRFASAGVQFACPDASLVSRSLQHGSVVRHFHQQGQSIAELLNALQRDDR